MKKCKECGIDFSPKNPKGIFCSTSCRQKDYRKSISEKLNQLKEFQNKKVVLSDFNKATNKVANFNDLPPQTNYTIDTIKGMPEGMNWREQLEWNRNQKNKKI